MLWTLNDHLRMDQQHADYQYALEREQALIDPREAIEDSPAAVEALVKYYLSGDKAELDAALEQVMKDAAIDSLDDKIHNARMGYDIDD